VKKFLIPIGSFAALGLLLAYALSQMQAGKLSPRTIPSPLVGKPLPSFTLPVLHEPTRQVSAKNLNGQVYLINVWASWCVACKVEHPLLMEIARQGVAPIIGLDYKDERTDGLKWLADHGNPYQVSLMDTDGRVGIELGVYGVPETFVIDAKGVIRYKHIGPIDAGVLREVLVPKIQELKAASG
jgi:cytochrome c biogenesis protein CcmG/thiol:disulfide interchange protein DsbE